MKPIKQVTMVLVLCGIPAQAFGQSVSCDACTHDVSVYRGDGGLIAEADGADMVTWVATCGGVTHHGELEPNQAGVVMLQFVDSGLVCDEEESRLQIGPVKDGGWYWITDDTNLAVGSLVSQDILDNARAGITNAGPGVTMTMGRGAVLLEEAATGRLGLLPNILPEPPAAPLRKCGYDDGGAGASPRYARRNTVCALGDGGTVVVATTTNAITGERTQIPNGGAVTRPVAGATETVVVVVDLWMNGSGHYTTSSASDARPRLGHPELAMTVEMADRADLHLSGVSYQVRVGSGPTASDLVNDGSPVAGVALATLVSYGRVTVSADSAYCSRTSNFSLPVAVTLSMVAAADAAQVTPSVSRSATGVVGSTNFTVVCP